MRTNNKFVIIHSCGDVAELFDDLHKIGVNCFNPYQPEVMDVRAIFRKYYNKLSFLGGLFIQKTLPFGTKEDVMEESRMLLDMGRNEGYVFSPSHPLERDIPIENMLAFMEMAKNQLSPLMISRR